MIVVSLVGGAIADRRDRRPVLALAQVGVIVVAALLFVLSLTDHKPPVIAILLLGGLLAGCTALDNVARGSIMPGHPRARSTCVAGWPSTTGCSRRPGSSGRALGGILIGVLWRRLVDLRASTRSAASGCWRPRWRLAPQPPLAVEEHPPVGKSIMEGLRFVVANKALAGSFVIDINAMLFGMPRALFAVLSLSVYHAGASGTGLLYSAIAVGGTLSVLELGLGPARQPPWRVTIAMVAVVGRGDRRLPGWSARSLLPRFCWRSRAGLTASARSAARRSARRSRRTACAGA